MFKPPPQHLRTSTATATTDSFFNQARAPRPAKILEPHLKKTYESNSGLKPAAGHPSPIPNHAFGMGYYLHSLLSIT